MAKRSLDFNSADNPTPQKITRGPTTPLSPSNIQHPDQHASVQAVITSLSPQKNDSNFFEGEVTDGECVMRIVGFESKQWQQLHSFCDKELPVTLTNCQIQYNKFKNKLEIVVKSYTKLEQSNAQFSIADPKTVGSTFIELRQLDDLQDYDRVTVRVTVMKITEPQVVGTGKTKQDITVADATRRATLTLWQPHINSLSTGQSYKMNRLEVRSYLGRQHLSFPSTGATVDHISDIGPVADDSDEENDDILLNGVTITGVQQLDTNYYCITCNKSIQPGPKPNIGICSTCNTAQKLSTPKVSAKLILDHQNKNITVRANEDALQAIVHPDKISQVNLLFAPAFNVVYNKFHVVTEISRQ